MSITSRTAPIAARAAVSPVSAADRARQVRCQLAFARQRMRGGKDAEGRRRDQQNGPQVVAVLRVQRVIELQPVERERAGNERAGIKMRVRLAPPQGAKGDRIAAQRAKQQQHEIAGQDADVEHMERGPHQHGGHVVVRTQGRLHDHPGGHDRERDAAGAPQRRIAQAAQRERRQDGGDRNQRAAVREHQRQHQREDQRGTRGAAPRVVAGRKRRPEQRVHHPDLGRETEDERTQAGRRHAGVGKDDAAARTIERPCQEKACALRGKEDGAVENDAALRIAGELDVGFGGREREEIDRQAPRDVVAVKCPRIAHRDRIGKERAVGVELQLIADAHRDKQDRCADPGGDHQGAQRG